MYKKHLYNTYSHCAENLEDLFVKMCAIIIDQWKANVCTTLCFGRIMKQALQLLWLANKVALMEQWRNLACKTLAIIELLKALVSEISQKISQSVS